jgi:DNA-directed RNA polymerase subunit K/omega
MIAAATTCIIRRARIMAAGAPGIVNGVMNESTNNATATTRKIPMGR